MGMRELESVILMELREVTGKLTLRKADMLEWTTGDLKPKFPDLEKIVHLPSLGVNVCLYKARLEKKKSKSAK